MERERRGGRAEWRLELGAMVTLAVPVVLSELGWMLMGVVDTIMVGGWARRRLEPWRWATPFAIRLRSSEWG